MNLTFNFLNGLTDLQVSGVDCVSDVLLFSEVSDVLLLNGMSDVLLFNGVSDILFLNGVPDILLLHFYLLFLLGLKDLHMGGIDGVWPALGD